jgi:hypothetical protein
VQRKLENFSIIIENQPIGLFMSSSKFKGNLLNNLRKAELDIVLTKYDKLSIQQHGSKN